MKFSSYFKFILSFIGILILMWPYEVVLAQYKDGKTGNGILPNITPVSPEASSLGKYGDWPVSLYTGTVNIAIPIYNIKVGNFELPIQLSYHTGGVKVDDVSSWCGTSWTLAAGGAITRSTVGLPDEDQNGFLTRNLRNDTLRTTVIPNNSFDPYNLNNPYDYVFLKRITDQVIDSEPDMFFYNFAGQSGKFYFDKQGNFQSIPVNSLKVINSPIKNPQISYWEIVDQKGNLFYFGSGYTGSRNQGVEYSATLTRSQDGGVQSAIEEASAWYLTKIILVNSKEVIDFDYSDKSENYKQAPVYSYRMFNDDFAPGNDNANVRAEIDDYNNKLKLNQVLKNGIPNTAASYLPTTILISGKSQLNKISWSLGEIVFNAEMVRQDIVGKNLSKIIIYDKKSSIIKENRFFYSYINERYYLDSLQEWGSGLIGKSAHSFEYESPNLLPAKFSTAQDHWGYYNMANGNQHLLPTNPLFTDPNVNANREPNESVMGYGVLKKIKYPTGGSTEFQYEGNRYDGQDIPGGGNPIRPIITMGKVVKASDPQDSFYQRIENFSSDFVSNNTQVTLRFKNYGKPPSKRGGVLPIIKLERKLADGSFVLVGSWDAYDNFPVNPVRNSNNLYDFDVTKTVNLMAADYRLTADLLPEQFGLGDPLPIMPEVSGSINYQIYQPILPNTPSTNIPSLLAGGLRIKVIRNFSEGNLVGSNQYNYTVGKLLIYPKYNHEYAEDVSVFKRVPALCGYLPAKYRETISTGQTTLGFTQGSPVGYQNVEERSVSPQGLENGYVAYEYSFTPDILNEAHFNGSYWGDQNIMNKTFPLNNNEYKRGLLLEKHTYLKAPAGNFVKIHSLTNHYEFNEGNVSNRFNSLKAMRVKKMMSVEYKCGDLYDGVKLPIDGFSPNFAYAYYNIFTGWVQNKYTLETTYDQNGQNPVNIRTDYSYDNPQHLQVTKTTKSSSDGNLKIHQMLYPHEMVAAGRDISGVYQAMVAKNVISPVIEESETLNSKTNRQLTNYIQPYNDVFVPGSIEMLNTTTGSDEIRLRYHNYDQSGNPLSVSLEGGIKINYLWGYNKQFLIAEIKNADYNEVQSALGGLQGINTLSLLANPTNTELNNAFITLRNALPNAQITTYTYKPLIGMTSSTDAKGMTTYYEYDALQRLKNIKDQNGNILKQTDYHYKN